MKQTNKLTAKLAQRTTLLAVTLAASSAAIGCANPGGSFDSFNKRYDEIFANKPPTACPEAYIPLAAGDGDGQYLFILAKGADPDSSIIFLADVTTPAAGSGVGLGMTITALDKTDRKTKVGDPQTFEPTPLDDSGKFTLDMPVLVVPKQANTIAPVDAEAEVHLAGNVCGDSSFVCGDVTGTTTKPAKLPLDGSTFTLMLIEDPNKYPDPVLDCQGTAVSPL